MNPTLQTETLFKQGKSPNRTYLDNRVINSQRDTGKKPRLRSSERVLSRVETKHRLVSLATEIHEHRLAEKLTDCHSKLAVLTCGRHVAKIIPNSTCEFRLCPDCARRRARKLRNKYIPLLEPFIRTNHVKPMHLILTQAHRAETLKQSVARLMKSFRKLIRRKFWTEHFKGGLWTVEFTLDKNGYYHTHLHVLVFRSKFCDVSLLRSLWKEITGDSYVVRLVKHEGGAEAVAKEVLKYAIKPLSVAKLTAENLRDFMKMKGARFVGTFGEFRDHCKNYTSDNAEELRDLLDDLSEGYACPNCSDPLFELKMSPVGLSQFYERLEISSGSSPPKRKT